MVLRLLIIILLFLTHCLFAEEEGKEDLPSYHKGKLLLEIGFGNLNSKISSKSDPNTLTELYFLYDVLPYLNSTDSQNVNLGIFKYGSYQKPVAENYNARFGIEYALLDWFGVGISGSGTRFSIKNITPGEYLTYPSYFILPSSRYTSSPTYTDYINLYRQDFHVNFGTIDVEASLHYPLGSFDPYIRYGYGIAPGYSGVYKSSHVAGFRFFWDESYIQIEYLQNFLYGIGFHIQQTDYLLERGFRFGLGYSFFN